MRPQALPAAVEERCVQEYLSQVCTKVYPNIHTGANASGRISSVIETGEEDPSLLPAAYQLRLMLCRRNPSAMVGTEILHGHPFWHVPVQALRSKAVAFGQHDPRAASIEKM